MVKSQTYGVEKNILIAPELALTISCIVADTGVTADANGRKIIKAGTPVGGTTKVVDNRQTALIVTNNANAVSPDGGTTPATPSENEGKNSQGIVLHDVDVTDGNANATLVLEGSVDLLKLDVTIDGAAKTALTKINFIKGANR